MEGQYTLSASPIIIVYRASISTSYLITFDLQYNTFILFSIKKIIFSIWSLSYTFQKFSDFQCIVRTVFI